jgi:sRNA-binding carbon storage regulator CsrA
MPVTKDTTRLELHMNDHTVIVLSTSQGEVRIYRNLARDYVALVIEAPRDITIRREKRES